PRRPASPTTSDQPGLSAPSSGPPAPRRHPESGVSAGRRAFRPAAGPGGCARDRHPARDLGPGTDRGPAGPGRVGARRRGAGRAAARLRLLDRGQVAQAGVDRDLRGLRARLLGPAVRPDQPGRNGGRRGVLRGRPTCCGWSTEVTRSGSDPLRRIEDLAAEAGTTVRNIRLYQEKGLLPPPVRRGRSALYGPEHRRRLRLVLRLLDRGYTFATIGELFAAERHGMSLTELLDLESGAAVRRMGKGR